MYARIPYRRVFFFFHTRRRQFYCLSNAIRFARCADAFNLLIARLLTIMILQQQQQSRRTSLRASVCVLIVKSVFLHGVFGLAIHIFNKYTKCCLRLWPSVCMQPLGTPRTHTHIHTQNSHKVYFVGNVNPLNH